MMKLFTAHPRSIGETYLEHLLFASRFGFTMFRASLACFIHAVFPFVFERTGSNIMLGMAQRFIERMPAEDEKIQRFMTILEQKSRCA